jgi:chromosome segregation ATPase
MVRDLLLLPRAPGRLLDDIRELKHLARELLDTENELTRISESMDRKMSALDTANEQLQQALDELRGFNIKLDRLDGRVAAMEEELRGVRSATDEIKDVVPDVGRGPLAKAKDAIVGEQP